MATTGELQDNLGDDNYTRLNPARSRTRAIRQLKAMG